MSRRAPAHLLDPRQRSLHAACQRCASRHAVFFTVDAGPQVKAVCLPAAADQVAAELGAVTGVLRIMRSPLGEGARAIGNGH